MTTPQGPWPSDQAHFSDGIDVPERLAFGLGAGQLLVVVCGAALAYALLRSPLPAPISNGAALFVGVVAAALGWSRIAGRPALDWARFIALHAVGPRAGRLTFRLGACEERQAPDASAAVRPVAVPGKPMLPAPAVILPLRRSRMADAAAAPGATGARMTTPPRGRLWGGAHRITFFH